MRQQIIDKLTKAVERGYTISEIARQINVAQPSLWKLYHGKSIGSVKTLEKIEAWVPKPYKRTRRKK